VLRHDGRHGRAPRRLRRRGIDCSGAGGTSWAKVEAYCARTERGRELGLRFGEWGIPTSESIANVRAAAPALPLIASGGLRSGIDLAKALALGADVGGMARPFLVAAHAGEEALERFVQNVLEELRICMFATGSEASPGCAASCGLPFSRHIHGNARMRRTLVLDVVGLTPALLGTREPARARRSGAMRPLTTVLPAVTTTVQSTFVTGVLPREHGIVGNGWYFRDLAEVWLWRQSNRLVAARRSGRRRSGAIRRSPARSCSGGTTCTRPPISR